MRRTKLKAMHDALANDFNTTVDLAINEKFGIETTTEFCIFSMRKTTRRDDGEPIPFEVNHWLSGFSEGYAAAMQAVERAAEQGAPQ